MSDDEDFAIEEKAHWHDMSDNADWIVSSLTTTDLDNVWNDDGQWDSVDNIETKEGGVITRKCLPMWEGRLCLCQFLEWIDSRKYKCYPRGQNAPILRRVRRREPPPPQELPPQEQPQPVNPELLHRIENDLQYIKDEQQPQQPVGYHVTGTPGLLLERRPIMGSSSPTLMRKNPKSRYTNGGRAYRLEDLMKKAKAKNSKIEKSAAKKKPKSTEKKEEKADENSDAAMGPNDVSGPVGGYVHTGPDGKEYIEADQMPTVNGKDGRQNEVARKNMNTKQEINEVEDLLGDLRKKSVKEKTGRLKELDKKGEETGNENYKNGMISDEDIYRRFRHNHRIWRKRTMGSRRNRPGKADHELGTGLNAVFRELHMFHHPPRAFYGQTKAFPKYGSHPGKSDVKTGKFNGNIPETPLHWHLAGVHAPNVGPQQHLIMTRPAHPDYPKKSYYMIITGFPKHKLPTYKPHWLPDYMWSQIQALQSRGVYVANDENEIGDDYQYYQDMTGDYDDYDYYYNNGLNQDEQELEYYYDDTFDDEWFDMNSGEQWVVLNDDDVDEIANDEDFNNDALWDAISTITTTSGNKYNRRCMNILGKELCLCQVLEWYLYGTIGQKKIRMCGRRKQYKVVKPPKDKPGWMPDQFWNYLQSSPDPHTPPSDKNRKKFKLYIKMKKKGMTEGYKAQISEDNEFEYEYDDNQDDITDSYYDEEYYKDDEELYGDEYYQDDYSGDYNGEYEYKYGADYNDDYDDEEYEYYDDLAYDDDTDDYYDNLDYFDEDSYYDDDDEDYYQETLQYIDNEINAVQKEINQLHAAQLSDNNDYDYEYEYDDDDLADLIDEAANYGYYQDLSDYEYDYEDDTDTDKAMNVVDENEYEYEYYDYEDEIDDDNDNDYEYDYEYYDNEGEDEEEEEEAEIVSDWWVDDDDSSEWVVSNKENHAFDNKWTDNNQWETISKVRTRMGRPMTRKCLHMWGHRLCLCQFLDWIDGPKYKCYPRATWKRSEQGFAAGNEVSATKQYQDYDDEYDEDYYDEEYADDDYEYYDDLNEEYDDDNDEYYDDLNEDYYYDYEDEQDYDDDDEYYDNVDDYDDLYDNEEYEHDLQYNEWAGADEAIKEYNYYLQQLSGDNQQKEDESSFSDNNAYLSYDNNYGEYYDNEDNAYLQELLNEDYYQDDQYVQNDYKDENYKEEYDDEDYYQEELQYIDNEIKHLETQIEQINSAQLSDDNEYQYYDEENDNEYSSYYDKSVDDNLNENEEINYYDLLEKDAYNYYDKGYYTQKDDNEQSSYYDELLADNVNENDLLAKGAYDYYGKDYDEEEIQNAYYTQNDDNEYSNYLDELLGANLNENEEINYYDLLERDAYSVGDEYKDYDEYNGYDDQEYLQQLTNDIIAENEKLKQLRDQLEAAAAVDNYNSYDYQQENYYQEINDYDSSYKGYDGYYNGDNTQEIDDVDDLYKGYDEHYHVDNFVNEYDYVNEEYIEFNDDENENENENVGMDYYINNEDEIAEDDDNLNNYKNLDEGNMFYYDQDDDDDNNNNVQDEIIQINYDENGNKIIVNNIPNNAWVWQLLILSFSIGVCSCLCYYATKVKPDAGVYDFAHYKHGRYSKVDFESANSAIDDIIKDDGIDSIDIDNISNDDQQQSDID